MKDPAILFYPSDFLAGTFMMSDEQVGRYIRLLCIQHQKGRLSEKDMLNICKTYDEDIFEKFTKDENGKYYNKRLEEEIQKRINYTESRRKNRKSSINQKDKETAIEHMSNICETHVQHMGNGNGNGNINRNIESNRGSGGKRERKPEPPTLDQVIQFFQDNQYSQDGAVKAFNYYQDGNWCDSEGKPVRSWKQKMRAVWFRDEFKIKHKTIETLA